MFTLVLEPPLKFDHGIVDLPATVTPPLRTVALGADIDALEHFKALQFDDEYIEWDEEEGVGEGADEGIDFICAIEYVLTSLLGFKPLLKSKHGIVDLPATVTPPLRSTSLGIDIIATKYFIEEDPAGLSGELLVGNHRPTASQVGTEDCTARAFGYPVVSTGVDGIDEGQERERDLRSPRRG